MSFDFINSPHRKAKVLFVQGLLVGVLLLLISNIAMPYEQDQPAKAAQLYALSDAGFDLSQSVDLYRKDFFSLYYLLNTFWFKVLGIGHYESMNLFTIACGVVFFPAASRAISGWMRINPWFPFCTLISSPAILFTFAYGNETALAISFLACAAMIGAGGEIQIRVGASAIQGLLLACAGLSRLDYLYFTPLFSGLWILAALFQGRKYLKTGIINGTTAGLVATIVVAGHFFLVVRGFERPEPFDYGIHPKRIAAFLLYGAGLTGAIFASVGGIILFKRKRWALLIMFLIAAHGFLYYKSFSTPKYILPAFVIAAALAAVGLQWIWRQSKTVSFALLVLPLFVSITPFGIHAGKTGAYYFVPTDDGPMPSGAIIPFCKLVREGFFQKRYVDEENEIREAIKHGAGTPGVHLIGFFNMQTPRIIGAPHGDYQIEYRIRPNFWKGLPEDNSRQLLIRSSYLNPRKMSRDVREYLRQAFLAGNVRALGAASSPLPDVIEIPTEISNAPDIDLGRRILTLWEFGDGEQWVLRKEYIPELSGIGIKPFNFAKNGETVWEIVKGNIAEHFVSLKSPKAILTLNDTENN